MKKFPVGIKICKRAISTVGIHLKGDIMVFHCFRKLPVQRFQISGRFVPINSYQITVTDNIKKSRSGSRNYGFKVGFEQSVNAFAFIKFGPDIYSLLSEIMNGAYNEIEWQRTQKSGYFFFLPQEIINFKADLNLNCRGAFLQGLYVIDIWKYVYRIHIPVLKILE